MVHMKLFTVVRELRQCVIMYTLGERLHNTGLDFALLSLGNQLSVSFKHHLG